MQELLKWKEWILREKGKLLLAVKVYSSKPILIMNIIVWNCRGASKPSFQKHVGELVRMHNPAMLVILETRVGGDRAKGIIGRLPFAGSVHTDTVGFTGGLWMLWDLEGWMSVRWLTLSRKFML